MANVALTRGGPYRYNRNSLAKNEVYQQALTEAPDRIAAEYMHGFFTLSNSFNPLFSVGQAEAIQNAGVKVGDFIALFKVPSLHTMTDVFVRTVKAQSERGYAPVYNSDGLVFSVEVKTYNSDTVTEKGSVELTTELNAVTAGTSMFKRSAIKPGDGGYFIPEGEFVVVGLKVESLPTDKKVSLEEVTSRVEVAAHVWDYEVVQHI